MDINTDDGIVFNVLLTRRWFIYAYRLASGETVAQALRLIDIHLNPETEKRLHTHSEVHLKEPGRPRRHNDDAILQLGNTPEAAAFASALADRRSQALNAL